MNRAPWLIPVGQTIWHEGREVQPNEEIRRLAAEVERLRERAEKAEALVRHAGDGIVQLDAWREALEARATRAEAENERLRSLVIDAQVVDDKNLDYVTLRIKRSDRFAALQPAATKGDK